MKRRERGNGKQDFKRSNRREIKDYTKSGGGCGHWVLLPVKHGNTAAAQVQVGLGLEHDVYEQVEELQNYGNHAHHNNNIIIIIRVILIHRKYNNLWVLACVMDVRMCVIDHQLLPVT